MPNHVVNILTIHASPIELKQVQNFIGSEEEGRRVALDFNQIFPIPENLKVIAGSKEHEARSLIRRIMSNELLKELYETDKDQFYAQIPRSIKRPDNYGTDAEFIQTIKTYVENYMEHGHTSWYEWCCDKWGTKWNAYEVQELNDNRIQFQTAWSTPSPVIEVLSRRFPKIKFSVQFADEDLGSNCGEYVYENGIITNEKTYQHGDEAGLQFACDLWEYDYEEIKAEREQDS